MRKSRSFVISLVALACAALPAAADAALPAGASLIACHPDSLQASRFMTVGGHMQAIGANQRLAIRFDLLQRLPGAQFEPIDAPGLGTWNSAQARVTRFRYRKRITNLEAPAGYRVVVSFRWTGPRGQVVAHAQRRTRTCHQPDFRADLKGVRAGVLAATDPQARTYFLGVRNRGLTATGSFDVVATVNGAAQPAQTVPALDAGARRRIEVGAPKCTPGSTISWAIDPDNRVDESDEMNNTFTLPCPAQGR